MSQLLTKLSLSRQEERVLLLSISGLGDKEIAKEMNICFETVRTYWQRIRVKVGGKTRAELIARLVEDGAAAEIEETRTENERLIAEISHRKKAEQQFRVMAEAAPIGVFVSSPTGDCVFVNEAWMEITGMTKEAAMGQGWLQTVHPEDLHGLHSDWATAVENHETLRTLIRFVRAGGEILFCQVMASQMRVEGISIGAVGTVEDVTERRRLETQLKASEERFRSFMDHLPGIAFVKDGERRLVYANNGFDEFLGFSSQKVLGLRDEDYLPEFAAKNNAANDIAVLESGLPLQVVEIEPTPTGDRRYLSSKFIFSDGNGNKQLGGLALDVTPLWSAEQKLRIAAEASFEALMILRPVRNASRKVTDFVFEFANQRAEEVLKRDRRELIGATLLEVSPSEAARRVHHRLIELLETGVGFQKESVSDLQGSEGRWLRYEAHASGDVIVLTVRDIHDSKAHQLALQEREDRLTKAELLGRVGSYEQDLLTGVSIWSKSLHEMLEIPFSEDPKAIDQYIQMIHPDDLEYVLELRERWLSHDGLFDTRYRVRTLSGETLNFHHVATKTLDQFGNQTRSLGTIRDVTQERLYQDQIDEHVRMLHDAHVELELRQEALLRANERLKELATTDGLTGLNNRRAFQERLTTEVALANRHKVSLTVVLIDVDHFKEYNDLHGHPAGDRLLERFSQLLSKNTRRGDCVARYGGEEFAVVLPRTDRQGGMALCEKMRMAIESEPWKIGQVTASFGYTSSESMPCDETGLISQADSALYQAKSAGRNRVCAWHPGIPLP